MCSIFVAVADIFDSKKPRLSKRSSSANWMPDRTTWKEDIAYKKAMGYLP